MTENPGKDEAVTVDTPPSRTATNLFDLRTVLAVLYGVYGLVLLILGLTRTDAAAITKAGGWNINLWSGVVMLCVAACFVAWVVLRPTRPPTQEEIEEAAAQPRAH